MALKADVLPAPLGPISDNTSPVRTSNVMSSTATSPPKRIDRAFTASSTPDAGALMLRRRAPRACDASGSMPASRTSRRRCQPLRSAGTMPSRQEVDDNDHQDAVDDPLHLGSRHVAQDLRHDTEDDATDDRPGEGALAAGDHHDHHRHRVDEEEYVRIDDADVVGVERAGRSRHRRRHDRGQHEITRDIDADRRRQRLVLAQRDHRAARPRAHEARDDDVGNDGHCQHQVVIRHFAEKPVLADPRQPSRHRRNVVQRHRTLGEAKPS